MLLIKAKAEALEYAVSEKDAEIDLLRQRQERQETQVESLEPLKHFALHVTPSAKCACPCQHQTHIGFAGTLW